MASLAPGTRLGPYEVTAPIGVGGMGEVYRARDTRLDRIVAIKVAKESFSDRVEREARAVATLNHPHICALFDVGPDYLVMEYIDGVPLQGPLPLARALEYGAQICAALDAAHRKGITHRDLKPSNILLTKSGVKLLDFGLAKMEPAVAMDEAAMTRAVTQQGQMLGTLHYMSPEQLQGQEIGPTSDIFSFGLVLYEMLTGTRAFDGASPASVIAGIVERPAPSIADIAPTALDRTLRRCLEKAPERRWHSAADLQAELEWIADDGGAQKLPQSTPQSTRWPWMIAAAFAVALGVALWAPWRIGEVVRPYRFDIHPSEGSRFSGGPVISPDGTRVAVMSDASGERAIEIHRLDTGVSQRLPGTRAAVASWSPDGRALAFVDQLEIKRVDVDGGPPIKIGDFPPGNPAPFTSWNHEGWLLFTGRDGLYGVSMSGGSSRRLTTRAATFPQFLPDGKHFLYWNGAQTETQNGAVYAGSIDAPEEQNQTVVLKATSAAVFARDARQREYLLFARDDTLMGQPFDARGLKATGAPFVVAPQIGMMGPVPGVSVSNTGVLTYTADTSGGRATIQYAWFDRAGVRLRDVGPPGLYREFSLSPDESQIAVAMDDRTYKSDIHLLDAVGTDSVLTRVTFDRRSQRSPVWSPDGSRILFSRLGVGLVEKAVRGGAERIIAQEGTRPSDWSRDGRTIVYSLDDDIMVLTEGKPTRYRQTEALERHAHLSPDGKLIAYTSSDSRNAYDVYVETMPASESRSLVPVSGGSFQPRWRSDGRELFVIRYSDAKLMAVPVTGGATIPFRTPVELFSVPTVGIDRGYAVASDGQRFLIPTAVAGPSTPIVVVTNWTGQP